MLTTKQRAFADEYLRNGGNAAQAALIAGYSKKVARKMGCENLTKPEVREYIDQRNKEIESEKVADVTEVMQFLTAVMRGDVTDMVVTNAGALVETKVTMKDRIKAAELRAKALGAFVDRVDQNVDMNLNITIDYGDES